jgi:Domain of unknown function (DUF4149)
MSFLRFVAVAALGLWIGGLAALGGIGAPAIFELLQAHDPAGGRELAGQLFGLIFERFQHIAWILGAVGLLSLGARAALGPRPRRFGLRSWSLMAMLTMSLGTSFFITPRIDAIRTSVHGAVASLPDGDVRKVTFGRLHGASNGLMLVTLILGLGLMWMETRDQH